MSPRTRDAKQRAKTSMRRCLKARERLERDRKYGEQLGLVGTWSSLSTLPSVGPTLKILEGRAETNCTGCRACWRGA